jgi:spermidine synthase
MNNNTVAAASADDSESHVTSRPVFIGVTGLFFLSGSAGLVYQVLWMRSLGLFFGSDMYGVAIILGTFMGGLALGSLLGGRLGELTARPLLWYGIMEIGIGIVALLVPTILEMFDPLLRTFYSADFEKTDSLYHVTRVVLAGGTLLLPTTLMGATLPLIMRHFVRSRSVLGEMAAFFYAVNTLGALAGTLVAGFLLLPFLGMFTSTLCTAAINLAVGISCVVTGLRTDAPGTSKARADLHERIVDTLPGLDSDTRARIARAALIGIAISGIGSFALEVVWTRILLMSFSATVYSFTSMLACFLFGIFFGSLLIARFVDQTREPLGLLAILELGVAATVALLALLVNVIPEFFGNLLGFTMRLMPGGEGGALVAATLMASFFLLVIPTTLLGATFSVALRAYTVNVTRVGSRTGNLYFANTMGAIVGSLGAVLFLLPAAGAKGGLALIAMLFAANGMYLWGVQRGGRLRGMARPAIAVPLGITGIAVVISLMIPYRFTLNFNQNAGADTRLIYHKEGIQNTIDIVRSGSNITSLVIGGNVEADNGYTQLRHFILKGHLPLMFLEEPESVLVVGLGMGLTLQATTRHPGLQTVNVVELSPEIRQAHAHLGDINGDVINNPLVKIRIDDGRSYMKLADRKYDMITADPIHPKVSRVGYLYTREYYQSIRDRLHEGGIVCQWMPIYQMSPTRLRSAMKTFYEVFPNATFWYVKNHGLFVAKIDSPLIDYRLLQEKFSRPSIREDLAAIDVNSPEEFLALLLMGPEEIRAFVDAEPGIPTNTDDYPYLEYFVPGDLFYQPIDNVRELVEYQTDPTRFVVNQPAESIAAVRALVRVRGRDLITELARPD